jgi:hypothetical protein
MASDLLHRHTVLRSLMGKESFMTKHQEGTRAGAGQADDARGEVLVTIMNNERDFGILQDELWYRVPVDTAPKR